MLSAASKFKRNSSALDRSEILKRKTFPSVHLVVSWLLRIYLQQNSWALVFLQSLTSYFCIHFTHLHILVLCMLVDRCVVRLVVSWLLRILLEKNSWALVFPQSLTSYFYMGWLRLVGFSKSLVSFAKEPNKKDNILQKSYNLKEPTNCSHPISISHIAHLGNMCVGRHMCSKFGSELTFENFSRQRPNSFISTRLRKKT